MQSGGYMYNQVWSTTPVFRYNLWCNPQQLRVPWALHLPLQIFIIGQGRVTAHVYTVNSLWNLNLQPVSPPWNPPPGVSDISGKLFFPLLLCKSAHWGVSGLSRTMNMATRGYTVKWMLAIVAIWLLVFTRTFFKWTHFCEMLLLSWYEN